MDHSSKTPLEMRTTDLIELDITLIRVQMPAFYQASFTSYLASMAFKDGYAAALIFDADEFFDYKNSQESMESELLTFLSTPEVSFMRVWSRNYYPTRDVTEFDIHEIDSYFEHPRRFHSELGKCIIKLDTYKSNLISTGSHFSEGRGFFSKEMAIRHFPFDSKSAISRRVEHGSNLEAANAPKHLGAYMRQSKASEKFFRDAQLTISEKIGQRNRSLTNLKSRIKMESNPKDKMIELDYLNPNPEELLRLLGVSLFELERRIIGPRFTRFARLVGIRIYIACKSALTRIRSLLTLRT